MFSACDVTGLVAVVTGGASGIGAAVVAQLREAGARVAVFDSAASADLVDDAVYRVDVRDEATIRTALERVRRSMGSVDIVVNSAGVGAQGDIAANTDDEWQRVFAVNVLGIVHTTRAVLADLRRSRAPAVCNVASIAALAGLPDRVLYSASKGAVVAMTRAMAADFVGCRIRVNAVAPGTTDTPWVARLLLQAADPEEERAALQARQPHRRLVSPAEVASAVAYLVSPGSASTNGVVLAVDGGMEAVRLRAPLAQSRPAAPTASTPKDLR